MASHACWRRVGRDAGPALMALGLSPVVAAGAPAIDEPLARMQRFIEIERQLGLFFEPDVHRWVAARPRLMRALDRAYLRAHLPVALGVLAWVRCARPHAFVLARDAFVATQCLAVGGYIAAPTAPPRMIRALGYDCRPGPGDHGVGRLLQSPYAAMPSAHAAFAAVAARTVASVTSSSAVRATAAVYPLWVVFGTIATGNHVWLDAVAGLLCAATGLATARAAQRLRGVLRMVA